MKFKDLVWEEHQNWSGSQAIAKFDNGYGVSVITGDFGRMHITANSPYELAVLKDGYVCYSTPIAEDVIPFLNEDEVQELINQVELLPEEVSTNNLQ